LRNLHIDFDFSQLAIKGKGSIGNILTRYAIHRIDLKEKVGSTLGGQKIWFDPEVQRLNTEARGDYIDEFQTVDRIIVFYTDGVCALYKPDLAIHFNDGICHMEKYYPERVYTVVYYEQEQKYHYIKRFVADVNGKPQSYLPEDTNCDFVLITAEKYPKLHLIFGGKNKNRDAEDIDVDSFIAVKGFKAKGKRLSKYEIRKVEELEPGETEPMEIIDDATKVSDEEIREITNEPEFIINERSEESTSTINESKPVQREKPIEKEHELDEKDEMAGKNPKDQHPKGKDERLNGEQMSLNL
jgi:topoisomerase-4 subunit A